MSELEEDLCEGCPTACFHCQALKKYKAELLSRLEAGEQWKFRFEELEKDWNTVIESLQQARDLLEDAEETLKYCKLYVTGLSAEDDCNQTLELMDNFWQSDGLTSKERVKVIKLCEKMGPVSSSVKDGIEGSGSFPLSSIPPQGAKPIYVCPDCGRRIK